jgi:hypothetical protein
MIGAQRPGSVPPAAKAFTVEVIKGEQEVGREVPVETTVPFSHRG